MITRLHKAGLSTAFIVPAPDDKPPLYRVRVGPISNVAEFDHLAARLAALGFAGARLAMD
jgi:cell division septation protein DedD